MPMLENHVSRPESTPAPAADLPLKTSLTIVLTAAMLWAVPHLPRFAKLGGFDPGSQFHALARFPWPAPSPAVSRAAPRPVPVAISPSRPRDFNPPYAAGFDPAMRRFEQALSRTDRKLPGAVTRILHYGDSPVTADSITADARSQMQARFGDAGHGFLLIAKPWAWYGHRGVDLRAQGWKIESATLSRAPDGFHGLGGVSFRGSVGAVSTVRLPDRLHTSVEVQYLEQPGGGSFRVSSANQVLGVVTTDGPAKKPAFARFPIPAGSDNIELAVTSGAVRAFGYEFEKPGPGIIYSSLGLNGGQVQAVLRYFEPDQWTAELQHAHPDLLILNYGTNESVYPAYIVKDYAGELRKVIARIQAALPDTSILIMSPMDRGEREGDGEIVTPEVLPRIVEIQKQVAAETGCAFFDTFQAMGGAGTMARWYSLQPRLVSADFIHPFPAGAAKVGTLVDQALVDGYERFAKPAPVVARNGEVGR